MKHLLSGRASYSPISPAQRHCYSSPAACFISVTNSENTEPMSFSSAFYFTQAASESAQGGEGKKWEVEYLRKVRNALSASTLLREDVVLAVDSTVEAGELHAAG